MPVEIDALEEWTVGDRMLSDMLARDGSRTARAQAEWRRGTLPPGQLGWRKASEIRDQAAELATAALAYRTGDPAGLRRRHRPGRRPSPDRHGPRSVRRAPGGGDVLQAGRQASAASRGFRCWRWPRHVPAGSGRRCVSAGSANGTRASAERVLGAPQDDPVGVLRDLVAIYDAGRREPMPLPIKTSSRLGGGTVQRPGPEKRRDGRSGDYAARRPRPANGSWGREPASIR